MRRPNCGDLQTTVDTLDWLAVQVEEQAQEEVATALRVARAFTAATLAATEQRES